MFLQTPCKFLPVSSPSVKTFHFGNAQIIFFFQGLLFFFFFFIYYFFTSHQKDPLVLTQADVMICSELDKTEIREREGSERGQKMYSEKTNPRPLLFTAPSTLGLSLGPMGNI